MIAATLRASGTIPVVREVFTLFKMKGLIDGKLSLRTAVWIGSRIHVVVFLPSLISKYNQL